MASVLLAGEGFGFAMFLLIGGGVVGLIVWSVIHQKKVRENWLTFARKNGLQIQGSTNRPLIQGWLGQVYITLNTVTRGSGKNRTTYTQYHASTNAPMPIGLGLHKEGFFSKVGKVFGGQDVQIGDRAIDEAFIIKATDMLGAHDLLSLAPVKKALLFCITRHPGMRITERNILVEHTGMTGNLAKIESTFEDLSYLALTLDAGYQQLASKFAPPQAEQTKAAAKSKKSASSRAAAAEILGAAALGFTEPARNTKPRKKDLSEMASALDEYAGKLERGEATPQRPSLEDAFASQDSSTAFDNPIANEAVDSYQAAGARELSHNKPSTAFDSAATEHDTGQSAFAAFDDPDGGDAFKDPVAFEDKSVAKDAAGDTEKSLDAMLAKLSDSALMSSDREAIIKRNNGLTWEVELTVERVDSTWGFDVPDNMRDGQTVEAHTADGTKFAVRFPKSRKAEVDKLKSGMSLKAWGKITAWDDLFKKATLDTE